MQALFYPAWDQLEMRDVPEPRPRAGEVVLRVLASGICGSELHGYVAHAARRTPPLIMGHEFSGEVVEVGPGVTDWRVGDRVVASSQIACGRCEYCLDAEPQLCRSGEVFGTKRPGAFAEKIAVPVATLMPLPKDVTPVQASLAEPLGNAVHALRLTQQRFPDTVVIIGAGTIGLFVLQVVKASGGLRVLVADVSDARLAVAKRLGADITINAKQAAVVEAARGASGGRGADVVIDAVGATATRKVAISAARPGGEIVWLGLHDDPTELSAFDIVLREKHLSGSFAVTNRDMRSALALFAAGKIVLEPWVRTFPLREGARVFQQLVSAPPDDYIKAVLVPNDSR